MTRLRKVKGFDWKTQGAGSRVSLLSKVRDFLDILRESTDKDEISWQGVGPSDRNYRRGDEGTTFYGTQCRGRNVGIFEYRIGETSGEVAPLSWESRTALGFFDDEWRLEWECPAVPGIYELMDVVRFKAARVERFLEEVLDSTTSESPAPADQPHA